MSDSIDLAALRQRLEELRVQLEGIVANLAELERRREASLAELAAAEAEMARRVDGIDATPVGVELVTRLVKVDPLEVTGTVSYRVEVGGRQVGFVGDGFEWLGHRHGARKWWACWREAGDDFALWDSGLVYSTRSAAVAALKGAAGCGAAEFSPSERSSGGVCR